MPPQRTPTRLCPTARKRLFAGGPRETLDVNLAEPVAVMCSPIAAPLKSVCPHSVDHSTNLRVR